MKAYSSPRDRTSRRAEVTLLLDIMGTGGHALGRARGLRSDIESLLIMGAGPIGLGVLAMARVLLPQDTPVYIADFTKYRLNLGEQLGGKPIDLSGRDADKMLADVPACDVAVDTSGKAKARQAALDALGKRGVLVCVGHGEGISIEVSPQLIGPERAVIGSEYFAFGELAGNLELLRSHRAYFNQIITHRFGVDEIQPAFELFFRGGNRQGRNRAMSTPGKIRVAIVGAGGWGRQHARVFSSRPDVDLVGLWSRDGARAQMRADEFATRGFSDLEEMLADGQARSRFHLPSQHRAFRADVAGDSRGDSAFSREAAGLRSF